MGKNGRNSTVRKWRHLHMLAYKGNHFQHSSLMNVDKHCRPILIDTDGPNAGDQVEISFNI